MVFSLTRGLPAVIAGSALIGTLAFAGTAFAAAPTAGFAHGGQRPAVVGTVASVSGDTLTVTARDWRRGDAAGTAANKPTTYTVTATGATVTKDGAASTVSAIAVGDTVMVQGAVSGTTVTATAIRDGAMGRGRGIGGGWAHSASTTPPTLPFTGNGSPVVGGSVTAISGSSLTVTTTSGTAYTVDASSATIVKAGTTSTLATIAQGDRVIVQGTVNGTAVIASSIIDQGTAPAAGSKPAPHEGGGFFGIIGGFFAHLFGF